MMPRFRNIPKELHMRATLAPAAFFLLISAPVSAEVVECGRGPSGVTAAFEVWGEQLPAADYLDSLEACVAKTSGAPLAPPPESPWLDAERAAYTNALRRQRVDVLVAPFQNQGYGLERTERAIMSADLAYHLDPGTRVADPFLTARALGEGLRRYDLNDIIALARAVGARTVVVAYIGHDLRNHMTLSVQVHGLDGATAAVEVLQKDWRDIPFTDAEPPFVALHRMLPTVVKSLPLRVTDAPRPRAAVAFPDRVSFSFADLADNQPAISPSVRLSVLGALSAAAGALARERLAERALVASWHFDADGDEATFVRAYALLNLEHRPAALALLAGSRRPEAVALRAVLNGDLPGATAALPNVANPLKRLLLAVHVDDLRHQYGRENTPPITNPASVFPEGAVDWLALVATRVSDFNQWRVDEPAIVKWLLDGVYPVAGLDIESLIGGGVVVGTPADDVAVHLATIRHIARFVDGAAPPVCCTRENASITPWDLVSLLEGRSDARLRKYFWLTTVIRGAPATAGEALARFDDVLEGHPLLAIARSDYAMTMAETSDADTLERWTRQAAENARVAAYWWPGQNASALKGLVVLGIPSPMGAALADAYGFDYPRRWYFAGWSFRLASGNIDKELVERRDDEAAAYSRMDIDAFVHVRSPMSAERKARLLADLQTRLHGHPGRASLLSAFEPPRPSSGDPIADARAKLAADVESWSARWALATLLIEQQGAWDEAAEVFLAHPHFHQDSPPGRVKLSNDAYEAGSIFYWGGHEALAIPLYEISAGLRTGSSGSLTSEIRLDILAGRYRSATERSLARAQRYPNAYAFRDFLSFLHAFSHNEEAWNGFSQVAAAFANPQIWVSALVGQRREGMSDAEIRAWLEQPGIRDAKFRSNLFAPRYAVLVHASDHETPDDLGALVAELEGDPIAKIAESGLLTRPGREDPSLVEILVPTTHFTEAPKPAGTPIKSEYVFFGAAYAAIKHGRFEAAMQELTAMARHYPLDRASHSFALPYLALAAAKTGDTEKVEKLLRSPWHELGTEFDVNLTRAFLHGARNDAAQARELLERALRQHPFTDYRPVLVEYQYAEACEWLFKETRDTSFIDLLLEWVVSQQVVQPTHAWPYAMEYTYARTPERRLRALAMTLYLDPTSPRIRSADAKQRAEAEAWGAAHNPFLQGTDPNAAGEATAQVGGRTPRDG
jgi:hypothetical protein